ncbi:MAG: iron-containing alcohol dehydrogenase, partial [Clostridia bacterium]|nr:iron-containing alcohol dehydrogenase [Clostridia bacterium]
PAYMRFTYSSLIDKFAWLYRLMKPEDKLIDDSLAAEKSCEAMDEFLKSIGMWLNWKDLGINSENAQAIVRNTFRLGDHKCNTRVPDESDVRDMVMYGAYR